MKKLLAERDEVIQASAKKIRATEKDLEEVAAKLAAKEVEVLTMELEVQECKAKLSEKVYRLSYLAFYCIFAPIYLPPNPPSPRGSRWRAPVNPPSPHPNPRGLARTTIRWVAVFLQ